MFVEQAIGRYGTLCTVHYRCYSLSVLFFHNLGGGRGELSLHHDIIVISGFFFHPPPSLIPKHMAAVASLVSWVGRLQHLKRERKSSFLVSFILLLLLLLFGQKEMDTRVQP